MDSLRRAVAVKLRGIIVSKAKTIDIRMHVKGNPKVVPVRLDKILQDEV
jgi:hypothetical protein